MNQLRSKISIFGLIVEALYRSRLVRVERTLTRYHDVIGRAQLALRCELGNPEQREIIHE